jgi:hypothetical protein
MMFPDVTERIAAAVPDARLVFVLRNPIDRIESHYRWPQALELEDRPLLEAFLADSDEQPDYRSDENGNYGYNASESRYGERVGRFIAAFGSEWMLVLTTDALRDTPHIAFARCAAFLGVDPFPKLRPVWASPTAPMRLSGIYNLISGVPPRSRVLRRIRTTGRPIARWGWRRPAVQAIGTRMLRDYLADDLAALRELTGCDFAELACGFSSAPVPARART